MLANISTNIVGQHVAQFAIPVFEVTNMFLSEKMLANMYEHVHKCWPTLLVLVQFDHLTNMLANIFASILLWMNEFERNFERFRT